jgi:hypothetical protein
MTLLKQSASIGLYAEECDAISRAISKDKRAEAIFGFDVVDLIERQPSSSDREPLKVFSGFPINDRKHLAPFVNGVEKEFGVTRVPRCKVLH